MDKIVISFVIPCYASEKSVSLVIDEIIDEIGKKTGFDYQVVAVNDCSPDNVFSVIKNRALNDDKIIAIDLAKNGGKHNALVCGCHHAIGDYVVFIDDDLQCPTDKVWDLLDPLMNQDYDISFARYDHKTQSGFKNMGSKLNDFICTWLLGKDKDLKFSNFSAMKKFVKDEIIQYTNPYSYVSGLMVRSTNRACNVSMVERERTIGVGHYTLKKSLALWMNNFTAFSVKPLRIASFTGIITAILGFFLGIYVVFHKVFHPTVVLGYSSLMAVILFIGGMLMLMLGLIGEYLGRIYISINNSPQFVIREIVNGRR